MILIFGIILLMFIITVSYIAVRIHVLERKVFLLMNVYEQSLVGRYGIKDNSKAKAKK